LWQRTKVLLTSGELPARRHNVGRQVARRIQGGSERSTALDPLDYGRKIIERRSLREASILLKTASILRTCANTAFHTILYVSSTCLSSRHRAACGRGPSPGAGSRRIEVARRTASSPRATTAWARRWRP